MKIRMLFPALLLCAALSGCRSTEAELLLEEASAEDADAGENAQDGQEEAASAPEATPEPEKIYVDVRGAVADPGVYVLESGSRVFQALEAAGGILPEGAGAYVNQARLLTDGQQVYVPTQEEAKRQEGSAPGLLPDAGAESAGAGGKVNINTADETQLTTLSGIGPSKAQAIIAYREENGGFSSIEEIMNVQGIKEGTFGKIKDDIAVE